MTESRLPLIVGRALMAVGLGVGVLAMVMWTLDITIDVPAWMWRVAAIKLTLASSIGFIASGALLLRHLKRAQRDPGPGSGPPDDPPRELGAPIWPPTTRQRTRAPQRVTTPTPPPTP